MKVTLKTLGHPFCGAVGSQQERTLEILFETPQIGPPPAIVGPAQLHAVAVSC
jgi:hypothetical protein